MHYESFEKARDAWNRRKARINLDNMIVIYMHTPFSKIEDVREDKLKFKHKIIIWDKKHSGQIEVKTSKVIYSESFTWEPEFTWDFKRMDREIGLKKFLKAKNLNLIEWK